MQYEVRGQDACEEAGQYLNKEDIPLIFKSVQDHWLKGLHLLLQANLRVSEQIFNPILIFFNGKTGDFSGRRSSLYFTAEPNRLILKVFQSTHDNDLVLFVFCGHSVSSL
jgi:hypothetical protein